VKSLAFLLFLILLPVAVKADDGRRPPWREYHLDVAVQIERSLVSGTVRFDVRAGVREIFQAGGLVIKGVTVNNAAQVLATEDGAVSFTPAADGSAVITYEGVFAESGPIGDRNYGVVSSIINARGVSLTGMWHPRPQGLGLWKLTAVLPAGYEAVSESESMSRTQSGGSVVFAFDFPHPLDSLSLVASDRFEVLKERQGNIEVFTYFLKEDRALAASYLEQAKNYLALYEKMLTPYPFKRFSVVENVLPTGYSLPTFTLLGQDVVRLPFIIETSLGHEILHQWFGNSVYVDGSQGNWAEGLTAYLADHWYDELKGKGWEHRKQLLLNYGAYVRETDDFPLKDFQSRMDLASRSVGYGKAALVFHQLRKQAGDEKFFAALRAFIRDRQFQEGSWSDIRAAFERETGMDLKPFFVQMLAGRGLPDIRVENPSMKRNGSSYELAFDVKRKNSALPAELAVEIAFLRGGSKEERIVIDSDRKHISFTLDKEPSTAVIDRDYDLVRILTPDETPPLIAAITGATDPLVVLPLSERSRYEAAIKGLTEKGGEVREAGAVKDSDLRKSAVVILGRDNPVAERLFGSLDLPAAGFSIEVRKNPWDLRMPVAVVNSPSASETAAAFGKIYHYGKYSSLSFENGRNRAKSTATADRGIILTVREEPLVLDVRALKTFSSIVEGVADKRIVYVGEYHDQFSHHAVQVDLIQALFSRDRTIAVGMEMFQRPFQPALDDYINGSIDEKEFLSRSEYFKRWGFDYNLYKPILDFCRSNRIPLVALNLRREITEKVSKGGMDSLTEEERKELPRETDFSDQEYRDRLREVFSQHRMPGGEEKNFDFFVQSQVLWDETMAESVDNYLRKNPGKRMVVIAGGGHIAHGSGIPKRVHRRNGAPYSIVMNDGELGPGIADFLIFPQSLDGLTAPKLMASFKEEKKRLIFSGFSKDGPAQNAGLRSGDALIAVDGVPVADLQGLKLALFYKKKGDVMLVTVERQRFLLGEKVMTVEVKL